MQNSQPIYHFTLFNLLKDDSQDIYISYAKNLEDAIRMLRMDKKYVEHITVILSLEILNPQSTNETHVYSIDPCFNNGWLQVHELTVPTCDITASYIKKGSDIIQRGVVCKEFLLSECSHYMFDNPQKPTY